MFLKGPSDSGKTTLLGLLGGVQLAASRYIRLLGAYLAGMSGSARDHFRFDQTGYIFQMFDLLPYLSMLENSILPCHSPRQRHGSVQATALHLLGQHQRVAAARALIGSPELVIPTSPPRRSMPIPGKPSCNSCSSAMMRRWSRSSIAACRCTSSTVPGARR